MVLPVPSLPTWPGGRRRVGMRRTPSRIAPVHLYGNTSQELPLAGAQALVVISGSGGGQAQVGPAGLGTVWYPASVAFSTSVTPFDTGSQVSVYVGPSGVPTTLVGQLLAGGAGVLALAIPAMSPGLFIIAVWTGAKAASTVSMNVTGSMTVLTR